MARFSEINLPEFPEKTGEFFNQDSATLGRLGTPQTEVQQGDVPGAIRSDTESPNTATRTTKDLNKREGEITIRKDIKTRFGVNLNVANSANLSKIEFIEGSTGGMQGALAYIRYWSRNGTQQRAAVNTEPVADGATQGAVSQVAEGLGKVITGFKPFAEIPSQPQSAPQTPPRPLPVNTQSVPIAGRDQLLERNLSLRTLKQKPKPVETGPVYNANPGAVTSDFGTKPLPRQNIIFDDSLPGKWQFLFNPEELQLESGPDYNKAETWGVSDPANSGQPLSWRSNKNRRLTFGKVLLTGYVIGKRVDSLEKGLQELFMARDGENGNDGPPVLEFVWGNRVFGPCVIQNIRVIEKAWDYGILVNAEVSFELEQVPEWTINDGFVDIARPGRQSTIADPALPKPPESGDTDVDQTGAGAGASSPAGNGGGSSREVAKAKKDCKDVARQAVETDVLIKNIQAKKNSIIRQRKFFGIPTLAWEYESGYKTFLDNPKNPNNYRNLIKKAQSTAELRGKIQPPNISLACIGAGIDNREKAYDDAIAKAKKTFPSTGNNKPLIQEIKKIDDQALSALTTCCRELYNTLTKERQRICENVK